MSLLAKSSLRFLKPSYSRFSLTQSRASSSAPLIAGAAYFYNSYATSTMDSTSKAPLISTQDFTSFKIKEIEDITHDTKLYRLAIPNNESLDLPVTSCLVTRKPAQEGEKDVIRPYTPVSDEGTLGHFDLLIKHYPTGAMTSYMAGLKPGDSLEVKGPFVKFPYKANTLKEITLIAGGSGITPMLQLTRKILKNPNDSTKITLIFANRTEKDIMLKSEFDKYAQTHPDQFKVHYLLDTPPANWTGGKGYVTKEVLEKHLPPKDLKESMVFVCGPDPMVKVISGTKVSPQDQGEVEGLLKEMGYSKEKVYKF
ncbi:NADH-cytochrome b5 reductase [Entomophthora muscae]|uniref:NADH-cytochrome b5 reductase n=1 Tax=Entomophthora muscae TaxID=34485 RepID=A0ACC2RW73_9FUNG|nr:NADH-cytochrome b5 reductase [Entomophthora muscae]